MQEEQRVGVVATLWCCRASIVMFVSAVVEIFCVLCGDLEEESRFVLNNYLFLKNGKGPHGFVPAISGTINFHFLLEQLFCTTDHDEKNCLSWFHLQQK